MNCEDDDDDDDDDSCCGMENVYSVPSNAVIVRILDGMLEFCLECV